MQEIYLYFTDGGRCLKQHYDETGRPMVGPDGRLLTDAERLMHEPGDLPARLDICLRVRALAKRDEFLRFVLTICKNDVKDWAYVTQHMCRMSDFSFMKS